MIPTVQECFELMDRYRMLANIRIHSVVVALISEWLIRNLQQLGHPLSVELAVTGALLHDIAKTPCLDTERDHAREGSDICVRHRFQEIADIVGEHVRLRDGVQPAVFAEKEIVFYADKRVNHDRIVNLEERLAYILARYGQGNERRRQAILNNLEQCRQVEVKLFARLPFKPEDLAGQLRDFPSAFGELDRFWQDYKASPLRGQDNEDDDVTGCADHEAQPAG
jgi:uncharacterized protein